MLWPIDGTMRICLQTDINQYLRNSKIKFLKFSISGTENIIKFLKFHISGTENEHFPEDCDGKNNNTVFSRLIFIKTFNF
jgi:hypothetical protein